MAQCEIYSRWAEDIKAVFVKNIKARNLHIGHVIIIHRLYHAVSLKNVAGIIITWLKSYFLVMNKPNQWISWSEELVGKRGTESKQALKQGKEVEGST